MWTIEEREHAAKTARSLKRIAVALERIADAMGAAEKPAAEKGGTE